ncbi:MULTISPECIES: TRAP transporter large permease [Halomonadaceae]|jgi:C4-dicarboxylate transporter, DctM subunit|uniref:TRAP transporter large permease protein n=1 Tax=Vreelandella titanicae TaxID=664683 RepID=A0A654AWA0_9GAMM|nr:MULTISPECIES: TRAP transporter large permease [Halomonas]QKS27163.1 C4-dicarboxylate TRAP transporter large permease protein DctM [Halomonas titanicae]TMU17783.1 TRAP transporter large permease [Halomonas sp. ATBC28]CAD5269262.1 C4-dicarboxylate TRAP transporter large permease protein DctM [Halomonas sp. I3]CAD5275175.1 C4-dicarboxylate TRAP transporter large permease protein DctM [Halomonas sp. 113]CAD5276724.1 C4-dicarboxylate TRAP transporter large permease protein DctM [Halomonas sp. 15
MVITFLVLLAVLMLVGTPIFIALAGSVTVAMGSFSHIPLAIVAERLFAGLDKFPLMAIPFFILTGSLMSAGGLSQRIIRLANLLVGRFTGGMGMTAVSASMFFGAISGSSPATVVSVGSLLYPAMRKEGYSGQFSIGVLVSAGSLGIIIPPSVVMIVYAAVTGVSVGALFMAGVGAGLLYAACLLPYCWYRAKKDGVTPVEPPSWGEVLAGFKDASWGLGVPLVVLGGIYLGIFTPTEAAAVSVVYALLVSALIYREKSFAELFQSMIEAATTTAQVMIILAAASVLAWFLSSNGLAAMLANAILSLSENPYHIFLLINVTVLIAGMFLDASSIMVILAPLFYTVGMRVGIDPVHLGAVLTVNGAIGMFTPPFGLNLFVAGTINGVDYVQAVRGALPFIGIALFALILLTYIPAISMWLPNMVYGG